jgi:hypothetical protein
MMTPPPENASQTNIRIWEKSVDVYVSRKAILKESIKKDYSVIRGKLSDVMRQKVETYPGDYEIKKDW